mgnify:FL=1
MTDRMSLPKGEVDGGLEAFVNKKGWCSWECKRKLHKGLDRTFYLDCTKGHGFFAFVGGAMCPACRVEHNWRNDHKDSMLSARDIIKYHREEYIREHTI